MLPLVRLVREKVNASGLSLRVFADDRRIAYSTLRRYYDKNLAPLSQPPRKETLRELALALDVPLREVEQAALESLSYRATPPQLEPGATTPAPEEAVIHAVLADPLLLPEAKQHLINQYGLLLRIQGSPAQQQAETTAANLEDLRKIREAKRGAKRPR